MSLAEFHNAIFEGIPQDSLPEPSADDSSISRAPHREDVLSQEEKRLAIANALRYVPPQFHASLAPEFARELLEYGRIYAFRYRPAYAM